MRYEWLVSIGASHTLIGDIIKLAIILIEGVTCQIICDVRKEKLAWRQLLYI